MSLKYTPDDSLVDATWAAVFLSERDVAGQIPIDFVTTSAVSLQAACFGNNIFDRDSAGKCISNLLASGFRRFLVDLYWSVEKRTWSFCPVTIPTNGPFVTVTSTASATPTVNGTSTTTAHAAKGTTTVIAGSSGSHLYELGPYQCSGNLELSDLIDVFHDFFKSTTSHLNVYTRFITFQVHAASSASTAGQPASKVSGADLPSTSERVGPLIDNQLLSYIYTPAQLAEDRGNLNESWYKVEDAYMPITEYFTTERDSEGIQSTPNGWPSTKYLQLARERRLLLEYGSVDPAMEDYPLSDGSDIIFPQGYLTNTVPVFAAEGGSLDSGCLYDGEATEVYQVNSSWAVSSRIPISNGINHTQVMGDLSSMVKNLTACGLTPTINSTLFNKTADNAAELYTNVSLSSSWAWAIGEPRDSEVTDNINEPGKDRCAVMDLSLQGRWRVVNCGVSRRAACRIANDPFTWTLSTTEYTYSDAYWDGCPGETTLGVPRTGLENTYLYRYLLGQSKNVIDPTSSEAAKHEVWIDFNSLDIASCWVAGGPKADCPYASDPQQLEKRTVLVAAIAGIVVCIITALTLFVKCNANRRNSRRGKRVIEGWEYEGVPS